MQFLRLPPIIVHWNMYLKRKQELADMPSVLYSNSPRKKMHVCFVYYRHWWNLALFYSVTGLWWIVMCNSAQVPLIKHHHSTTKMMRNWQYNGNEEQGVQHQLYYWKLKARGFTFFQLEQYCIEMGFNKFRVFSSWKWNHHVQYFALLCLLRNA
jgi:hypothetical protein